MQTLHRARDRLVGERTALINQMRAILLERGSTAPQGRRKLEQHLAATLDGDSDGRCDTNSSAWNTATWSALTFQITDQVYFVYSYDSDGKVLNNAHATANAHADLDCDGIKSTFQRIIFPDPNAMYGECSQVGASAYFVDQETE